MKFKALLFVLLLSFTSFVGALDGPNYTRQEDVIYGRKFGTALTMDVVRPKEKANGLGIVYCVSGGWFSSHDGINGLVPFLATYLERGYTIFAVVHGSQPKFTIPEAVQDMNRAVRFIRFHAKDSIDPDHIGITGGSAGGHLSLMMGAGGDQGDPKAKDPIDRVSSRIQCVACFFPPTDFLNYGKTGNIVVGRGALANFAAPFDFHDWDPTRKLFVQVTDEEKIKEAAKKISPITHVTADSAPTLIMHGDKDLLVPMQQSEIMIEKLKAAGVDTKLIVKSGEAHGWQRMDKDVPPLADWFDAHLKKTEPAKEKEKAAETK